MRKILLIVFTVACTLAFNNANAQWCGNVNTITPSPNAQLGFPNPDLIPCAADGVPYYDTIAFKMYSSINFQGSQTIDSVTIDTIWNLPCGLCWSLDRANRTYAAGQSGNLLISGTTYDVGGQYNLRLQVTAYINGNPQGIFIQSPNEVDQSGIRIWLRVDSAGTCNPVNTNDTTAVNQSTSSPCNVGINQVAANVPTMSVVPNPMNSTALLAFTAERSAAYTMRITDLTGQVVSVKEIQANSGSNTLTFERGKLSSGIYFLSLTDGVSSVTRKFVIMD